MTNPNQNNPYLHIFLMKYYYNSTTPEEQDAQLDTDCINFGFEDMTYTIPFLELKQKADEETIIFNEANKIVLKDKKNTYKLKLVK